jgi:uncharacterized protein YggT (Ycf19 family)
MIIITNNILVAPLAVVVFLLDAYLFVVGLRTLIRWFAGGEATRVQSVICALAETPVQRVRSALTRLTRHTVPPWVPWTLIVLATLAARQALAAVIVSMS